MENATKALIIAGAVLIAILLISVGILVFNAANDPINQAQNSSQQQAAQMFNSQFTSFMGENVSGTQAKTLINAINSSNQTEDDHKITVIIGTTNKGSASGVSTSLVKNNKKYTIEDSGYDGAYINEITIK